MVGLGTTQQQLGVTFAGNTVALSPLEGMPVDPRVTPSSKLLEPIHLG